MLADPIHDTIVRIDALVVAFEPFPALVTRDAQGDAVFRAEFFEFAEHTGGYDGDAFGVETVHHCGEELEFVLDGVGEEVCVDEDVVGGDEGGVVLEEEGGADLWSEMKKAMVSCCGTSRVLLDMGRYISRTTSSPFAFRLPSASPLFWFFLRRASRWPIILLTAANFLVFLTRLMMWTYNLNLFVR